MSFFRFSPLLLLSVIAALFSPTFAQAENNKPVKVFILAGQSNMQGHCKISMGKEGDLDHAAGQDQFAYLKKDGQWVERDDVWYYHLSGKGELTK